MLKGISPFISSDLLVALHRMGHGDQIVLADAFFPAHSVGPPVIEAAGVEIVDLLGGILPLFTLDQYVDEPLTMMQAVEGDALDPTVAEGYETVVKQYEPDRAHIRYIDRFGFYEEAASAFVVVLTATTKTYANVMLAKGVTT